MKNLKNQLSKQFLFAFLFLTMPLLAHTKVVVKDNNKVVIKERGYSHHERVYVGHPWYHRDHVVIHEGYAYPAYYEGYPYYYYTPQYYYYDGDPTLNVNVRVGG